MRYCWTTCHSNPISVQHQVASRKHKDLVVPIWCIPDNVALNWTIHFIAISIRNPSFCNVSLCGSAIRKLALSQNRSFDTNSDHLFRGWCMPSMCHLISWSLADSFCRDGLSTEIIVLASRACGYQQGAYLLPRPKVSPAVYVAMPRGT